MRPILIALQVGACLLLTALITLVAILWCDLSHRHADFGPLLVSFSPSHGIHLEDLLFLAVELVLGTVLTVLLIAGFTRPGRPAHGDEPRHPPVSP